MNKERYWSFILYPDTAPDNWERIITETGLQWVKSPLHDSDIWKEDSPQYVDEKGVIHEIGEKYKAGDKKKAHFHVLLCFKGPTTYKRVCDLIQPLNCTIPKRVLSCCGIIRYFTHEDDPDKYHYNKNDIVAYNGLDLDSFNDLTESETDKVINDLIDFITDNNIYEYADFINYIKSSDNYNFLRVARRYATFFCYYINSKRNKIKSGLLK